jgi:hypothetical protein
MDGIPSSPRYDKVSLTLWVQDGRKKSIEWMAYLCHTMVISFCVKVELIREYVDGLFLVVQDMQE